MKILNFGSLNIDFVYGVPHIVRPGETLATQGFSRNPGGKGLNQSIALAKAGARVYHAGKIGPDGLFLKELLEDAGVDTCYVSDQGSATGCAIIQVDEAGQNAIIVHGGANFEHTEPEIGHVLSGFQAGDWLLLQNEVNQLPYLMEKAAAAGLAIVLNPSPVTPSLLRAPLEKVSCFILNETEGQALTGETLPGRILSVMKQKYPAADVVLTLGERGAVCRMKGELSACGIYKVKAVDTTAAGDTFTGFFLASLCRGSTPQQSLRTAAKASAIAVSRPGAAPSIPSAQEVNACGFEEMPAPRLAP